MSTVRNAIDRPCRMDECETPREDVALVEDPGGKLLPMCGPCRSEWPVEVVDGDRSRFETPPGVEVFDGVKTEYPYRVEDADGQVVFRDLDVAPPPLNTEEIDVVSSNLEKLIRLDQVDEYDADVIRSALRKLPDGEHDRGELPESIDDQGEA